MVHDSSAMCAACLVVEENPRVLPIVLFCDWFGGHTHAVLDCSVEPTSSILDFDGRCIASRRVAKSRNPILVRLRAVEWKRSQEHVLLNRVHSGVRLTNCS